ncbi:MAG: hypothetical protein ACRDST_11085 [Pseudonocardiaceae bacterium]
MSKRQFTTLDRILTNSACANGKRRSGDLVAMLLKKRFLSSPWSFARTLELYEQAAVTGRQLQLNDEDAYYEEVLGSGQSDEEEGEVDHPEFTALRQSKGSDPLVTATSQDIASLIEWGRGYEHRPDSRLEALITFLDAICRPDGTTWTNERVVVFTEYATTLDWIARVWINVVTGMSWRRSRARRPARNGRRSAPSSPRTRPSTPCACSSRRTPRAKVSIFRHTATGW